MTGAAQARAMSGEPSSSRSPVSSVRRRWPQCCTMLSGPRARRLLVAYLVVGLVFSLTVGTVIVVVLQGYSTSTASTLGRAIVDVVLGAAASRLCRGVLTRRRSNRPR